MTSNLENRDEEFYLGRAETIPVDEGLLEPLGRVLWAAIRLHHVTRDCLEVLDPHPVKPHFDQTLGAAIRLLRKKSAILPGALKKRIELWCDKTGIPAAEVRDGVAHAIVFSLEGDIQAIGGSKPSRPTRYQKHELLVIAGKLDAAFLDLSQVYYEEIRLIEPEAMKEAA